MYLVDTNIAIYLRDREPVVTAKVADFVAIPRISIMTWVELENGVARDTADRLSRRISLDTLLAGVIILDVDHTVIKTYRDIVTQAGYSRPRTTDRLIAATAVAHNLTLITINGHDFRDIPALKLETWSDPAAQ